MAIAIGDADGNLLKDGYIFQTPSSKYVSLIETAPGSGALRQVIASRRAHVVWRLLDPKEVAAISKNSTRDSCNIGFDSEIEETKVG